MYSSSSCVHAVNFQARSLCTQRAVTERNRFMVGTCSLHDSNEISLLEYREDSNQIDQVAVFSHPDQIWSIDSSPRDTSLLITCRQPKDGRHSVSLWKMPNQTKEDIDNYDFNLGYEGEPALLEEMCSFAGADNSPQVSSWNKIRDSILLSSTSSLSTWSLTESTAKLTGSLGVDDGIDINIDCNWSPGYACWDPHASHSCAAAFGTSLHIIDTRKMEISTKIAQAHAAPLRSVDYNPNRPMVLSTTGEDRKIKFWDLRNLAKPVKTLLGHSHWVYCGRYNPFHDQLFLSGGSDNVVNLWRIASCSSAPWLKSEDAQPGDDLQNDPPDVKVRSIDQHEDTVYDVAWSCGDAWIYASLSYDGRLIINHVPSPEKYKILL